jgi:prepilin-type N-terminal cleavage/methylation domain-containing protein
MRTRRGMTLMELVIGVTITGMMAAAGSSAFSSIIDHRKVVRDATLATERAAALRDMIRTWIVAGQIQIQQGGGPRGMTLSTFGVGSGISSRATFAPGLNMQVAVGAAQAFGDELTVTTTAENPAMAAQVRIRLYIDADANTPETGLTMEYQPNTQTPLQRRQLDATIGTIKVEFLDRRTNRWFAASEAATIQPRALRLTLGPAEGIALTPLLVVPMYFVIGDPAQTLGTTQ